MSSNDSLIRQYLRYIIPAMVGQLVFTLYTIVDGIFVARGVSETALAAVSIVTPFVTLLFAISLTFAVGTSTIVARLMGENRFNEAREVFSESVASMMILSLTISAFMFVFLNPICHMLGATTHTLPYVKTYLLTIVPFIFSFIVSYHLEILLATDGHPAEATIIVTISVFLNIFLDWLTIFRLKWGIAGAGLATSFSQTLVIVVYMIHFAGPKANIRFKRFKFRRLLVLREFLLGLPSGITELSPGLLTFIFNNFIVLYLHERELVVYSILSYIILLASVLANGISQGSQPLISYYHGRREKKSFLGIFYYEIYSGIILAIVEIVMLLVFGKFVAYLFIDKANAIIPLYVTAMKFIAMAFPMLSINIIIAGYFTALERPRIAVIISLMRCTVTLIFAMALMTIIFGANLVWLSLAMSELISLIIAILIYRKFKMSILVEKIQKVGKDVI